MRVEQLMVRPVQSCRPEETLERAAQLMWEGDCGSLPVCGGNGVIRPVGMITDRDITMCSLFHGKSLRELRVSDAMAKEVRVCRPGDSLADAEAIMREARIRRLPVVGSHGELIGVISLADLALEAVRERKGTRNEITDREVGGTLAAICEPGRPHAIA
jgi:CBS domain-containing protein